MDLAIAGSVKGAGRCAVAAASWEIATPADGRGTVDITSLSDAEGVLSGELEHVERPLVVAFTWCFGP